MGQWWLVNSNGGSIYLIFVDLKWLSWKRWLYQEVAQCLTKDWCLLLTKHNFSCAKTSVWYHCIIAFTTQVLVSVGKVKHKTPLLPKLFDKNFLIYSPVPGFNSEGSGVHRGGSSPLAPLGVPGGARTPLENTKLKGNYV